MSIDQKHLLKIVAFKTIDFKSRNTGEPGQMKLAQCIVTSHSQEKGEQIVVGELLMPRHLADTQLGDYLAEFELAVGKDLRLTARLVQLHPVGQAAPVARPAIQKDADKKVA